MSYKQAPLIKYRRTQICVEPIMERKLYTKISCSKLGFQWILTCMPNICLCHCLHFGIIGKTRTLFIMEQVKTVYIPPLEVIVYQKLQY